MIAMAGGLSSERPLPMYRRGGSTPRRHLINQIGLTDDEGTKIYYENAKRRLRPEGGQSESVPTRDATFVSPPAWARRDERAFAHPTAFAPAA
jgi:hypothetical protein